MLDDELFSLPDVPLLFGRFLVHQAILTDDDVAEALRVQDDLCGCIASVALERQIISQQQFIECREYQRRKCVTFAVAAQALDHLSGDALNALHDQVYRSRLPLGQILVRQGKLTHEQLVDLLEDFKVNGTI